MEQLNNGVQYLIPSKINSTGEKKSARSALLCRGKQRRYDNESTCTESEK